LLFKKNKEKERINKKKMKNNEKANLFKNNKEESKKQINYLKQKKIVNGISFLINFHYKINSPIENIRIANKENKKISNSIFNAQKIIILNIVIKLFIFCLYFTFSQSKIRKLEISNEISITILGDGTYQTILGSNVPIPNEVIIDGQKMDFALTNYKLEESEHNIIFKWNSPFKTCNNMFFNIERVLTVDFSNFDSSQITDVNGIFFGCKYLKSINFKNFGTSLIKSMDDMFFGCNSLISIDLSGFDTSSVTTMRNMFRNCSSLKSLDLSSFKTSSLTRIENMFYDAESLLSLDLSNFNISLVEAFPNTFYGCKSLVFIT
jgi:surface protein